MTQGSGQGQAAQEPKPQTPRRVPKTQIGVPEVVTEMRDWFVNLERSVAGYNHLHLAFLSFAGQLPDGERKKGLPILTFKASVNGRDAIEVVSDLKKVDPQYVPHVLVPLINAQAADMIESVNEIEKRIEMLRELLASVQPQPQADSSAA